MTRTGKHQPYLKAKMLSFTLEDKDPVRPSTEAGSALVLAISKQHSVNGISQVFSQSVIKDISLAHGYSFILEPPSPTYKPSMSAREPEITTDIGNDATLSCTGEQVRKSTSATRLFWKLNGTTLDTSAAHYNATNTFYHQDDGSTPSVEMRLMIFDVGWPDAGVYICGVYSILGEADDEVTLKLKGNSVELQRTLLWDFGAKSE